jgi:glutamate N-acetyltransferase/amino-acid N-acetyltransferase
MECIGPGIRAAAHELDSRQSTFERAARAILTTDTHTKVSTRTVHLGSEPRPTGSARLPIGDTEIRLTGFAKGAAMIGPNLATMLAFVLTDAAVAPADLASIARRACNNSFNCISVEGHESTNDSVLFFANGAGPCLQSDSLAQLEEAATEVCADLARGIAADAEGASHFVTICVEGLRDDADARRIAKTVAESALVKTAIFGADPNWGRIVSAAGYAGVPFEEEQLSLWLGDMLVYDAGVPLPFDAATATAYMRNNRDIYLRLRFTLGTGRCTFWTCDLGYEYVRLNAEYTT